MLSWFPWSCSKATADLRSVSPVREEQTLPQTGTEQHSNFTHVRGKIVCLSSASYPGSCRRCGCTAFYESGKGCFPSRTSGDFRNGALFPVAGLRFPDHYPQQTAPLAAEKAAEGHIIAGAGTHAGNIVATSLMPCSGALALHDFQATIPAQFLRTPLFKHRFFITVMQTCIHSLVAQVSGIVMSAHAEVVTVDAAKTATFEQVGLVIRA